MHNPGHVGIILQIFEQQREILVFKQSGKNSGGKTEHFRARDGNLPEHGGRDVGSIQRLVAIRRRSKKDENPSRKNPGRSRTLRPVRNVRLRVSNHAAEIRENHESAIGANERQLQTDGLAPGIRSDREREFGAGSKRQIQRRKISRLRLHDVVENSELEQRLDPGSDRHQHSPKKPEGARPAVHGSRKGRQRALLLPELGESQRHRGRKPERPIQRRTREKRHVRRGPKIFRKRTAKRVRVPGKSLRR